MGVSLERGKVLSNCARELFQEPIHPMLIRLPTSERRLVRLKISIVDLSKFLKRIDVGKGMKEVPLGRHVLGFGCLGVVGRNRKQKIPTGNGCRLHRHILRLDVLEARIVAGVNDRRVVLRLGPKLGIDAVVNLVEPLPGIPAEGVLLDELGRRLATEPTRKNILHRVEHIIGVLRSERNEMEKLPRTRPPEACVHYS